MPLILLRESDDLIDMFMAASILGSLLGSQLTGTLRLHVLHLLMDFGHADGEHKAEHENEEEKTFKGDLQRGRLDVDRITEGNHLEMSVEVDFLLRNSDVEI